jgi:hypothetical protein
VGSGEIMGEWRRLSCPWQESNCDSPTPYPSYYRDYTVPGPACILCAIGGQEDDWRMESNAFVLFSKYSYYLAVRRDSAHCQQDFFTRRWNTDMECGRRKS